MELSVEILNERIDLDVPKKNATSHVIRESAALLRSSNLTPLFSRRLGNRELKCAGRRVSTAGSTRRGVQWRWRRRRKAAGCDLHGPHTPRVRSLERVRQEIGEYRRHRVADHAEFLSIAVTIELECNRKALEASPFSNCEAPEFIFGRGHRDYDALARELVCKLR